jgi:hypothetical protein
MGLRRPRQENSDGKAPATITLRTLLREILLNLLHVVIQGLKMLRQRETS